jgi:glycosyltransferase involved in cell wall biosynthesis
VKIAFIYRGDPRHRTANRVSIFHNLAAATRLGHEVVLVIPRAGMSAARARQEVDQACADFGISERLAVKTIPRPALKQRFRRSFDFLSACWVRAGNFDLVWSREFHAADYATAFGLKAILEHHHPFTDRQWKVARRMLGRESFKGVAAISGVHQQMLLSEGWPKEKVIVAHSGVDVSRFTDAFGAPALRGRLADSNQPIVLYAGSLFAGKGGDQILATATRMPQIKFICVGGREGEVAEFRREVGTLRLTNIEFIGHVPHARVPEYLLAADILVAPFTEEARDIAGKIIIPFSSPIKLFEYMAAGKAIVASDIGAIPEILAHGVNGLLVTPGDVSGLAGAISRLLNDSALARRLAGNAQKDARQYTWDERVARVLELATIYQAREERWAKSA